MVVEIEIEAEDLVVVLEEDHQVVVLEIDVLEVLEVIEDQAVDQVLVDLVIVGLVEIEEQAIEGLVTEVEEIAHQEEKEKLAIALQEISMEVILIDQKVNLLIEKMVKEEDQEVEINFFASK